MMHREAKWGPERNAGSEADRFEFCDLARLNGRTIRRGDRVEFQLRNARQARPDNEPQVAVEGRGVPHGALDLLLAFVPDAAERAFLGIKIALHGDEGFDKALDFLAEFRPGEILEDEIDLAHLA